MKLRVTMCAAVLLPAAAAFAQSHPWPYGPYDKLRSSDARVQQPFENIERSPQKKMGVVVIVPAEKKADTNARPINYRFDYPSRVNYFKLVPPKSKGQ